MIAGLGTGSCMESDGEQGETGRIEGRCSSGCGSIGRMWASLSVNGRKEGTKKECPRCCDGLYR